MRTSPKGYPSLDLCIILTDGRGGIDSGGGEGAWLGKEGRPGEEEQLWANEMTGLSARKIN